MKANELRIGNWIEWAGKYIQVSEISQFIDIDAGRQGWNIDGAWLDDCSPIPITPEILEKAGFVKHPYCDCDALTKDGCTIDLGTLNFITVDYEGTSDDFARIGYVHQLQNLYFALTGEELQIEL